MKIVFYDDVREAQRFEKSEIAYWQPPYNSNGKPRASDATTRRSKKHLSRAASLEDQWPVEMKRACKLKRTVEAEWVRSLERLIRAL